MSIDIYIERAADWLAVLTDGEVRCVDLSLFAQQRRLTWSQARKLWNHERVRRKLIGLADLSPPERRELIDLSNLNLHALAAGPIMDPAALYLPAGKLSMADTIARERAQLGGVA